MWLPFLPGNLVALILTFFVGDAQIRLLSRSQGECIASGGNDNTIRIWDIHDSTWKYAIIQLPNQAWAAITPRNQFKLSDNFSGGFWHTINLCRFEPGELDQYLPDDQKLRLPDDYDFLADTR